MPPSRALSAIFPATLPAICTTRKTGEDAEGFRPYVYLDVSDGFALWEKAIEHHWFAVHSTSFPYKEYYSHLKRLRGIEGRKGYCECFMIPAEQMRIVKKLEDE